MYMAVLLHTLVTCKVGGGAGPVTQRACYTSVSGAQMERVHSRPAEAQAPRPTSSAPVGVKTVATCVPWNHSMS